MEKAHLILLYSGYLVMRCASAGSVYSLDSALLHLKLDEKWLLLGVAGPQDGNSWRRLTTGRVSNPET